MVSSALECLERVAVKLAFKLILDKSVNVLIYPCTSIPGKTGKQV